MSDPPRTALIVDDNFYIRATLRMFIEGNTALEVCGEAVDGLEAIQKAKEQRPSLILMDLSMPNMNGVDAACIIRNELPDARIVMFTLYSDALGRSMAKAAGVDVVISKSEGTSALMDALRVLLADCPPPAPHSQRH